MVILDGRKVATAIEEEIKKTVDNSLSTTPRLGIITIGENPASEVYVRQKLKAAERCGIHTNHTRCNDPATARSYIRHMTFSGYDGIIVQLPLPEFYADNTDTLINYIPDDRDVDGLTYANQFRLVVDDDRDYFAPCTPEGVMRLLEAYNVDPDGMNVTIIGRSKLVGGPLAQMMLRKNATVTVCHSKTSKLDLIRHCREADIVVSACGVPNLVNADMLKDDAVVIDVGISRVDGKLCGDVDIQSLEHTNCKVTPVPGGVGPMTVAILMEHVVKSALRHERWRVTK